MNIKIYINPAPKQLNFLKLPQTMNGKLYLSPAFQKVQLYCSTYHKIIDLNIYDV